jgi:hydrogenase-4 transcriptional activator
VKYHDLGVPLKQFKTVLLDLWRAVSRSASLELFAAAALAILGRQHPLSELVLIAIGEDAATVTVLARSKVQKPPAAGQAMAEAPEVLGLPITSRRSVADWLSAQQLPRSDAGKAERLILESLGQDAGLVVPLRTDQGVQGALVLLPASRSVGLKLTEEQLARLAEPFQAALINDARQREVQDLRTVVEGDQTSGRARLGRGEAGDGIVGARGGLRQVLERVQLVARADLPVLLFGETGAGKEVIARAIHEQSPRAGRPFIRVNCGAIPPELIDSELFGHERGAFTGAVGQRRGWFERATGGTLLLDEVGELPLPAQVRLLRVLQDGSFTRVGGERSVQADVRIIAATHRDLPGMVQAGAFREDLWYRISSFPIVLPPLRERRQDIAPLVEHFARRAARRFGLRPQAPTRDDLALLAAYPWPGNVRELISVIDRAAILGQGQRLDIQRALGPAAASGPPGPAPRVDDEQAAQPGAPAPQGRPPLANSLMPLDQAMRRHIEAALVATRGRIEGDQGAARLLMINPHTLRARMRKLGVDWSRYR